MVSLCCGPARDPPYLLTLFPPGGEEQPGGTACLIQDPADPAMADVAFTVADDWQGRGVGTALTRALLQHRRRPCGG